MPTFIVYRFEGMEKRFVFKSLFNRKPVMGVKDRRYIVIRLRSLTDESKSLSAPGIPVEIMNTFC